MTKTQSRNTRIATADLDSALESIEQQCQTLRWRLINFDANQSIGQLDSDLGTLMGLACQVSRHYGRLEGLADNKNAADDAPPQPKPDADGTTDPIPITGLAASDPKVASYNVIQLFGDTEIVAVDGGGGEYPKFETAQKAAIDYLEDVIDRCQCRIEEIEEAEERYGDEFDCGTEAPTDDEKEDQGNVQMICGDHYQPDPEIEGRPLPWFLGKTVKLRFPVPRRPENGEFMWVAVNSIRGEELVGTLTNDPLYADQCCGDEIVFRREDVLVIQESDVTV